MKNIVIIGGNSGISLAVLSNLLKTEHRVFAFSRHAPEITHPHLQHFVFDATKDVLNLENLPDVLHGFAYFPGSIPLLPFERTTDSSYQQAIDLHFLGMTRILRALLPLLKKEKSSVVLMSTVATQVGLPFHSVIAPVKSMIEGFMRSMAAEYAPKIRFNAIAPSLTDTPLAQTILRSPAMREQSEKRHPLGMIASPEDIASIASYLLSEEARFITGQVFVIDGGLSTLKSN
jgi:3-oxoacyl-[acyl-carrier protein] reductase